MRVSAAAAALLSFQLYDIKLEVDPLNAGRKVTASAGELAGLQSFAQSKNIARLYELAREAACQQISAADFPAAFAYSVAADEVL